MILRWILLWGACLVGVAPSAVRACSCMGVSPIAEEVERADAVIVGRAVRLAPTEGQHHHPLETTVVEVLQSIKGDLTGEVHVSRHWMCYQTLPADELQEGMTYVLPLYRLKGEPAPMAGNPYPGLPLDRVFELPECAESGIVLQEGQKFSPEMLQGAERSVLRYLRRDIVWVVVGSLAIIGGIIWRARRRMRT